MDNKPEDYQKQVEEMGMTHASALPTTPEPFWQQRLRQGRAHDPREINDIICPPNPKNIQDAPKMNATEEKAFYHVFNFCFQPRPDKR